MLAAEIRDASEFPVHIEQHDESLPEDQRHPDIDFYNQACQRRWIDVAIVTPWSRSLPSEPQAARAGALAASMENTNRRKYAHLPLIPAVWEHLGRPGASVQALIKGLHAHADPNRRSAAISRTWQTLSVHLQRENVAMLASAGELIRGPAC